MSAISSIYRASDTKYDKSYRLPEPGADWAKFKSHFDTRIRYDEPGRLERIREYQVARAMFLSHQWLNTDTSVRDAQHTIRFTDPDPKSKIPRPVNNEIYPIVDNEAAKLYRRKSTAYVRPVAMQEGTVGAGGAAKANDIMEGHLESISWPRKRRTAIFRDVLYGITFLYSYLDQTYGKSVRVGISDAQRCMGDNCDFALAGKGQISSTDFMGSDFRAQAANSARVKRSTTFNTDIGEPETNYSVTHCLQCGAPLRSWIPTEDTDLSREDPFGRSFAQQVPFNTPDIEVRSPYDVWVENDGIGFDHPSDVREWYFCTPRSIDYWIADHYPDLVDEVEPDDVEEINQYHPVATGYSYPEATFPRNNAWKHSALVKTAVILPCRAYPLGRFVEMAGDTLFQDSPLCRKSTRQSGILIPKVKITAARFIIKDGELHGQGIVKPLASLQNRINMTLSQIVDTRQRNGVSGVMATTGMRLTSGWLDGYVGRFIRWEPDPNHPDMQPQFIDTKMIDGAVYQELDRTVERMQQISGTQDVDIGKAPRNVSAATAIQILQESAAGRREGREQELIDAFKECYSHQLLLLAEYALESRTYLAKNRTGKWEQRQFLGSDLAGHTDVMVEEQAGYDARSFQREAYVQLINLHVINPTTPFQRREAMKYLGLNPAGADEENVQISDSEAKWYAFRDFQIVPKEDESLDDHWLMYQSYGLFLKSPEGRQMAQDAGWDAVQAIIPGWEDKLTAASALEQQVKQLEAQAKAPPNRNSTDGGLSAALANQSLQALAQHTGQPLESLHLPALMSAKILYTWQHLGVDITNPYTQFRALHEAHRLLGMAKKGMASIVPVLAAPGGGQTVAGTEPIQGAPALPGPGEEASGVPAGGASPEPVQA